MSTTGRVSRRVGGIRPKEKDKDGERASCVPRDSAPRCSALDTTREEDTKIIMVAAERATGKLRPCARRREEARAARARKKEKKGGKKERKKAAELIRMRIDADVDARTDLPGLEGERRYEYGTRGDER